MTIDQTISENNLSVSEPSEKHLLDGMNILLISRHFPPINTGGSRRSILIVEALERAGANVCVAAPLAGHHDNIITVSHPQPEPSIDQSKQKSRTPLKVLIKDFIRRNFLLPDPDIRWTRRVVKAVNASGRSFDWVVTTSPPESIHYAGYRLSHKTDTKWLADMRDFWLENSLYKPRKNPIRAKIDRLIARKWLSEANEVIAVSESITKEAETLSQRHGIVISQMTKLTQSTLDFLLEKEKIHIAHTGSFSLSDSGRHIETCLNLFSEALARNPKLHLHLAGRLTVDEIKKINSHPARHHITNHGLLEYDSALALQKQMHALVVFSAADSLAIPGKFYEYKRAGRPVFGVGGPALTKLTGDDALEGLSNLTLKKIQKNVQGYDVMQAGQDIATLMLAAR